MNKWKVLICDDDETIHELSSFILEDIEFMGRNLQLLHAYTVEECLLTLKEHPDTALILQDMVMEQDESGLILTKKIREELKNKEIRIILRTGKICAVSPKELVELYDISDYMDKTEFTSQKLRMVLYTSLMDYHRISELLSKKKPVTLKITGSSS